MNLDRLGLAWFWSIAIVGAGVLAWEGLKWLAN